MPYMVRPDILRILGPIVKLVADDPEELPDELQTTAMDLLVTWEVALEARTFLFSAEQALALRPALARFGRVQEFRLPFRSIVVQFSEPIAETEFFALERDDPLGTDGDLRERSMTPEGRAMLEQMEIPRDHVERVLAMEEDAVLALLLDQRFDEAAGEVLNTAAVWFASGSVNRVAWHGTRTDVTARVAPTEPAPTGDKLQNKETIRQLALALMAYINAENMVLERVAAPEKVNRKRRKHGKAEIEPYYVCRLRGVQYAQGEGEGVSASGRGVSFRFDVRGHFRQLPDGRLTWVRPHQRGVQHELYRPKVYEAD